ncbi:MAG TPA: PstS family phosphate ABC transporter substrate-binding protein [Aquimonas sp.]|nr:PstS family phosphate ABC transporter substrate-binding protein [Xanthomonadales bacterium]HRD74002.1 PstS family phosphate ABC transporter substrate-binding protein [Aquimonas sp.]HRF55595.1 PstS family phosphate ABC transporter substrate-binding protein [Aquimonas sp.]
MRSALHALCLSCLLGGCGTPPQSTVIRVDGSSTAYPLMEAVAEEYMRAQSGHVRVTVGVSGTGGGFKKFCRGETDVAAASRPIAKEEADRCAAAGVRYVELPLAYDAITVVVNPQNTWVHDLSIEQLRLLWAPQAQGVVVRWNQLDPRFPDQPIHLFGAGADSGTFDYFTEAVVGRARSSRGDYTASEDDNLLVTGVAGDQGALGFFGFAYYEENASRLKALGIRAHSESAPVQPSREAVMQGKYQPLSRKLLLYVNTLHAQERPELVDWVHFALLHAQPLIDEVRNIPLDAMAYQQAYRHFDSEVQRRPLTALTDVRPDQSPSRDAK